MTEDQKTKQLEPQMKPCPFCGEQIMETAKKCKHCGEFLDPVLRSSAEKSQQSEKIIVQNVQGQGQVEIPPKSRMTYVLLDLFFGIFGIHNIYAGFVGTGIIQLILSCTVFGLIITIPWCILELLFQSKDASGRKML
mgnify:CR=1 FL=1